MTETTPRQRPSDELRRVALEHFATSGFTGSSLQQIADRAGYSKSSVLYHFSSKEALLEAAIGPAIDALESLVDRLVAGGDTAEARQALVTEFIDFLFAYRLEVFTFINQGQSLRGIPVMDRANAIIHRLADAVCDDAASVEEHMRFGVALGGAAYTLVADMTFFDGEQFASLDEMRDALVVVVGELLAPARR